MTRIEFFERSAVSHRRGLETAMSECQKQFEAWFSTQWPLDKDGHGGYIVSPVDRAWRCWQAAWNARTGAGL